MPQWRRTLITVWITQFMSVAGFSFVVPFLPYYVQELGITDMREITLWAGAITSVQAISMALVAPVWGALSDRYGRKLMVMRATYAGAIVMAMMGLVANVQQLLLLRLIQGALTGTVSATTTLVASIAPKERAGSALGSLQTAVFLGVSMGPLAGGILGDTVGYRTSFFVTGLLLLISAVLVTIFVKEDFTPAEDVVRSGSRGYGKAIGVVLASGTLMALLVARVVLRMGTRVLAPVLALFVQQLLPESTRIATITGLISGVSAFGSAVGSPLIGQLGDRYGHRRLLVISSILSALTFVPQTFVQEPWSLLVWQLVNGFVIGGTLSTLTVLLARASPSGHEGVIFGLDSSAVSAANGIGPMLGAAVAAGLGLRMPFLVSAGVMGLGVLVVVLSVRERQAISSEDARIGADVV